MSAYTATGPITALYQGDSTNVWDNEVVAATSASRQVAFASTIGALDEGCSIELSFDADPGNFSIDFQTSDTDDATHYVSRQNITQTAMNASFVARMEIPSFVANFGRLLMNSIVNAVHVTGKITKG